jgi:hypothetical protein
MITAPEVIWSFGFAGVGGLSDVLRRDPAASISMVVPSGRI